jgi:hypothetical protein
MPIYLKKKKPKAKKDTTKDWSGIIRAIRYEAKRIQLLKQNQIRYYVELHN